MGNCNFGGRCGSLSARSAPGRTRATVRVTVYVWRVTSMLERIDRSSATVALHRGGSQLVGGHRRLEIAAVALVSTQPGATWAARSHGAGGRKQRATSLHFGGGVWIDQEWRGLSL